MFNKVLIVFALVAGTLSLVQCGNENPLKYDSNTQSRGYVTIYVEESVRPLFETSIFTFEGTKLNAHITAKYDREIDVINAFIQKKTKAICIGRDFSKQERLDFKNAGVEYRTKKIVLGAIALIVHQNSKDTILTADQFLNWCATNDDAPTIVFDNVQGTNFNYFLERIPAKKFGKHVKALSGNQEVIDYIKTHENAIGVIGFNWISDLDDPKVKERLTGIHLVEVSKTKGGEAFPPYAQHVFDKSYPFTHFWYLHNFGSRENLEAGFFNFMELERGQLIIRKAGLVSYFRIPRQLQFTTYDKVY